MALNCKRKIKEIMVIFCFLSLPRCLNLDSIWFAKKLYITIQVRGIVGNFCFEKKLIMKNYLEIAAIHITKKGNQ